MNSRRMIAGAAALLIALSSSGTALPGIMPLFSASASGDDVADIVWEYKKVDGGIKLMKANQQDDRFYIEIPKEIDGQKVVEISSHILDGIEKTRYLTVFDDTVVFDGNLFADSHVDQVSFPEYCVARAFEDGDSVSISYPFLCFDLEHFYYYAGDDTPERYMEKYCDYVDGKYIPKPVDLTVPAKVAGADVIALEWGAFAGSKVIDKVTLPDTIRIIYNGCFSNSTVSSVNIPDGVRFIPDNCFSSCTRLEEIHLPDSVIAVGDSAFYDTKFNDPAIYSDNGIFGDGGWMIAPSAEWNTFYYFDSDLSVKTMPIQYLGNDAVVDYPTEIDGFPVKMDKDKYYAHGLDNYSLLEDSPDTTEIRLPEGIDFVPRLGNSNLTKVNLPASVTEIDEEAFVDCMKLTSVTIPATVKKIKRTAFAGCENLSELIIEGDSLDMEWDCFRYTAIKSVELPGSCTMINSNFSEGLESVTFRAGDILDTGTMSFRNISSLKNVTFSPDIKEIYIRDKAFSGSGLETLELGSNVREISNSAFRDCPGLKNVTISGTSRIGGEAFADDLALEKVVINGAHKIEDKAFSGCIALEDLDIDTACNLSHNAFNGCEELYRINGKDVIGRNSTEFPTALDSFIRKNFDGAENVGFVNRFVRNSITAVVKEVVDDDMPDVVKAKVLHDWLCEHTEYAQGDLDDPGNHTDSSVFMDGVAVCEGYSRTYNLLLREAGLKSWFVTNNAHSWNVVMIDNKPYHIDTTWDDTESSYNWFLRTDKELIKAGGDHAEWKACIPSSLHSFQEESLPVCVGMIGDLDNDGDFDTADIGAIRERILSGAKYELKTDLDFNGRLSAGDVAGAILRLDSPGLKMGDVDRDGLITSADASQLLSDYALMSVSEGESYTDRDYLICDVNVDGQINAVDASAILGYYTYVSTGGTENIAAYSENN